MNPNLRVPGDADINAAGESETLPVLENFDAQAWIDLAIEEGVDPHATEHLDGRRSLSMNAYDPAPGAASMEQQALMSKDQGSAVCDALKGTERYHKSNGYSVETQLLLRGQSRAEPENETPSAKFQHAAECYLRWLWFGGHAGQDNVLAGSDPERTLAELAEGHRYERPDGFDPYLWIAQAIKVGIQPTLIRQDDGSLWFYRNAVGAKADGIDRLVDDEKFSAVFDELESAGIIRTPPVEDAGGSS